MDKNKRWSARKHKRVPSSKVAVHFPAEKHAKHKCAHCGKVLHGVPHGKGKSGVSKLSKTERRPSVVFAGILCADCRSVAIQEAAKVKYGLKEKSSIDLKLKKYIDQAMNFVE
jgi:large subunit ribosomal protein L34e